MSRTGGYQIIDLASYPMTSGNPVKVPGVYSTIESTRKVVLISGVDIDGTEYHDHLASPVVDDTSYKWSAIGHDWVVSQDDNVTATAQV